MNGLLQDIRFALRSLLKSPGFTAVAVLTLALGIGSTTSIFSVIYGVLLRPLAVPEARQVVEVVRSYHGELEGDGFTYPQFRFFQEHSSWSSAIAAFTHAGFNLAVGEETQRVSVLHVSSDYFRVLGATPILGREFTTAEDRDASARVAILSQSLWTTHFAGDRSILDRTIHLNGMPYRVVGIMPAAQSDLQVDFVPPAFGDLQHVDLWSTLAPVADSLGSGENLEVIARVKASLAITQASAQLDSLSDAFRNQWLQGEPIKESLALTSVQKVLASGVSTYLWILLGAVAFVLLIACANISNLLLVRGIGRGKEVSIRAAMGASRPRLIRQFLLESMVLSVPGGFLGFFVAEATIAFLLQFVTRELPRASEIHVDFWALLFALIVAVLFGTVAGAVPALRGSKIDVNVALKENSSQSSSAPFRNRFRSALVVTEIALSLMLLVGASLLAQTFLNLLRVNPGFDSRGMLSAEIWLTGSRLHSTAELDSFYNRLITHLKSSPGVQEVGIVSSGQPLERGGNVGAVVNGDGVGVDFRVITPQYFRTLRVSLLRGRDLEFSDTAEAEPVALVNEAFAKRVLKDRDPFTSTIRVGDGDATRRIVGVVSDIKSFVGFPADPTVFLPAAQTKFGLILGYDMWFPTHVLVRTSGDPHLLANLVEEAIRDTDSSIPVGRILPLEQILARSLSTQRFMMLVVAVFAILAVILAAVGIYGVIAFSVSQRTRELGIRMALGANVNEVLFMILREGAWLALIGAFLGLAGTLALHKVIASVLFGVQATEWRILALASLSLWLVASFACYLPARRATEVDPNVALRCE